MKIVRVIPCLKKRSAPYGFKAYLKTVVPALCLLSTGGTGASVVAGGESERLRLQAGSNRVDKESFKTGSRSLDSPGANSQQGSIRTLCYSGQQTNAQTGQRLTGSQQTRVLSACGC